MCVILSKRPLCQTTLHGCSPKPCFANAVLLTLGRAAPLLLMNNSHVVVVIIVDDLMYSACEQDDSEQVFTKLADHGNGRSMDAELDTRSKGPCISLNNSLLLQTRWVFFWRWEKSGLRRMSFASSKQVTATLIPLWQGIPLSHSGSTLFPHVLPCFWLEGPRGSLNSIPCS